MKTNQLCNDYNYILSAKLYKIELFASENGKYFQVHQ